MIPRLLISFITLSATLGGAVFQGVPQTSQQQTLLVFKTETCGPCKAWKAAYDNPLTGLRVNINRRYRMQDAIVISEKPELARRYGIDRVPTFLLVDGSGNEVHRVVGFTSPAALLNQLMAIPRVRPPQTRPQQAPTVDEERVKRLEEANQFLEDKADSLEDQLADRQNQSAADRGRARQELEALREQQEQQQLDLKAALEKLKQKAVPSPAADPECKDGVCPVPNKAVPAQAKESRGAWQSILHHGVALALDFGLTQAQSEIAIPLVVAGGPVGIAAGAGFMLFKAWRRRRNRKQAVQQTVVVDAPALPPKERIDTQFVNVESDNYQRAHEQARQQVVRRYPGSQEILEAELSLTHQFLSGQ